MMIRPAPSSTLGPRTTLPVALAGRTGNRSAAGSLVPAWSESTAWRSGLAELTAGARSATSPRGRLARRDFARLESRRAIRRPGHRRPFARLAAPPIQASGNGLVDHPFQVAAKSGLVFVADPPFFAPQRPPRTRATLRHHLLDHAPPLLRPHLPPWFPGALLTISPDLTAETLGARREGRIRPFRHRRRGHLRPQEAVESRCARILRLARTAGTRQVSPSALARPPEISLLSARPWPSELAHRQGEFLLVDDAILVAITSLEEAIPLGFRRPRGQYHRSDGCGREQDRAQ